MSKKIKSTDKINDTTLHEILLMMDARLKHIEDIEADNRDTIIKLVKQGNQIVEFLKQIEIDDITDEYDDITSSTLSTSENLRSDRMQHIKEMVEEYMDKHKELKEFEEELKKNKDKLTPGQIGES
jgi:hypothetical protein|tara:strand:- start:230 stop:607 length:378 start_codon:yes stop_codon:yes gene_type:complete